MPFADDRVQIYGGGGGVYIRYSERIHQPFQNSGFRVSCVSCSLRDGVGYYAVAGVSIAIDRAQLIRVGGGTKVYRGATSGDPLGPVPGVETRDRWYNIFGSVGISF
jgi:hypothetical protein